MKKLIASLTLILVIACPWASFGQANIEKRPSLPAH